MQVKNSGPHSEHQEHSVRSGHWFLYFSNMSAVMENPAVLLDCF